jgi:hypothetical protein
MYTEKEYKNYYIKNNRFPDGQYNNPQKILNERQVKTKYEKYCKRYEKKQVKENSEYKQAIFDAEKNVIDNDPEAQEFWSKWNTEERYVLNQRCLMFKNDKGEILIDPAHVFGRGEAPQLSSEELNIIPMPRYFHSLIDQYINPITGKAMKKEEHEQLWRRIVGDKRYDELLEMKRNS